MISINIQSAIDTLDITMYKLSVRSGVRPNTISDYVKGNVSRIDIETLNSILNALNIIAYEKGIEKRFDLWDIMKYKMDRYQIQLAFDDEKDE